MVESFFATLKNELIYHRRYQTRTQACSAIFACIHLRVHRGVVQQAAASALGYLSQADYDLRTARQLMSIAA